MVLSGCHNSYYIEAGYFEGDNSEAASRGGVWCLRESVLYVPGLKWRFLFWFVQCQETKKREKFYSGEASVRNQAMEDVCAVAISHLNKFCFSGGH